MVALGGAGHLVVVEVVHRGHPVGDELRDDVAAHVVIGVVVVGVGLDGVDQDLGGEHVVAHRHERLVRIIGRAGRVRWFFHEAADPARLVGIDAAERGSLRARHADTGDRCTGAALDVLLHHLLGIHPVHVIGTEDDDVVGILVVDEVHRLVDGVRRPGVPARPEPLLRGDRRDVFAGQPGQPPVLGDVPVQRMRLVLRENTDAQITRIDEVRQHEIDEPVTAAERNGRLGPIRRQGIQPLALPAGEDDAQHVWRFPHGDKPIDTRQRWPAQ